MSIFSLVFWNAAPVLPTIKNYVEFFAGLLEWRPASSQRFFMVVFSIYDWCASSEWPNRTKLRYDWCASSKNTHISVSYTYVIFMRVSYVAAAIRWQHSPGVLRSVHRPRSCTHKNGRRFDYAARLRVSAARCAPVTNIEPSFTGISTTQAENLGAFCKLESLRG